MSSVAWLAFLTAAGAGAVARYLIDVSVRRRTAGAFPWGTLVVNVSGSLLLGLLTGFGLQHGLSTTGGLVLGTGFCGAYTTFSTFSFETVKLLEEGAMGAALRNAVGNLAACALAAAAGLGLTAL